MTLADLVNELCSYHVEKEWLEFKLNWFNPDELGEYIAALSNSAAYVGRRNGYLVWGIDDTDHKIRGTNFDPDCAVKGEPLKHCNRSHSNNEMVLHSRKAGEFGGF